MRPRDCARATARALTPLVVEKTSTSVSSSQGAPVFRSREPPHRSTTFSPRVGAAGGPKLSPLGEVASELFPYRLEAGRHVPADLAFSGFRSRQEQTFLASSASGTQFRRTSPLAPFAFGTRRYTPPPGVSMGSRPLARRRRRRDGYEDPSVFAVTPRPLARGPDPRGPLLPPAGGGAGPLVRAGARRPALRRGRQVFRGSCGLLQAPARHVLRGAEEREAAHEGGRGPPLGAL